MAVCLFFVPESPRWLILTGRFDEGVKSLRWLRPANADVDSEASEIQAAIDREMELGSSVGVLDMFKNPVDRRRTILAVCAVTLQAASGSMFIIGMVLYLPPTPNAKLTNTSIQGLFPCHVQGGQPVRHDERTQRHGHPGHPV
jgi:hypothetical protein